MKLKLNKIILITFVSLAGCTIFKSSQSDHNDFSSKIDPLLKIVSKKIEITVSVMGDSVAYPRSTASDGKWKTGPIRGWTSGFFPGILWYMQELTGDQSFKKYAERWTEGLAPLQYYSGSHDIGFMVYSSYGNGYRLFKNEEYRKVIVQTAATLTTRFNPTIGCIKSWDNRKWPYPVIIDNMMNLELLFWAAKNGGTQRMYDIAFSHAEKTMQNHFRPDGSTYHVLSYDTLDGSLLWKGTHQGYADTSCWSRGQAWALYGFTMSYRFTRDQRFLQTAMRAADYFIDHLPADKVPYWDFQAPNIPNELRDASAAAIAASGLFELSGYSPDDVIKKKYFSTAVSILQSLSRQPYFTENYTVAGIISYAVGNKPAGNDVDVSLIYGDYYYIEALMRYKKLNSQFVETRVPGQ